MGIFKLLIDQNYLNKDLLHIIRAIQNLVTHFAEEYELMNDKY